MSQKEIILLTTKEILSKYPNGLSINELFNEFKNHLDILPWSKKAKTPKKTLSARISTDIKRKGSELKWVGRNHIVKLKEQKLNRKNWKIYLDNLIDDPGPTQSKKIFKIIEQEVSKLDFEDIVFLRNQITQKEKVWLRRNDFLFNLFDQTYSVFELKNKEENLTKSLKSISDKPKSERFRIYNNRSESKEKRLSLPIRDRAFTNTFQNCTCIFTTLKAILVEKEDHLRAWIPISMIEEKSEVKKEKDKGKLIVKDWFAMKMTWCFDPSTNEINWNKK